MTRLEELKKLFENVDNSEVVDKLLDDVVFLEERMSELKKLPFIEVHPKYPQRQRTTAAAKLYKECSQSYMNAVRILAGMLNKVENDEANELLKRLEEFQ